MEELRTNLCFLALPFTNVAIDRKVVTVAGEVTFGEGVGHDVVTIRHRALKCLVDRRGAGTHHQACGSAS